MESDRAVSFPPVNALPISSMPVLFLHPLFSFPSFPCHFSFATDKHGLVMERVKPDSKAGNDWHAVGMGTNRALLPMIGLHLRVSIRRVDLHWNTSMCGM